MIMFRRLTIEDKELISLFLQQIGDFSKDYPEYILNNIDSKLIVTGHIKDGNIQSLLIASLIKNQYYLGDVMFTTSDIGEIKELIRYMIDTLRSDERGLNIIYDNFPYSASMDEILLETGFKCSIINYVYPEANNSYAPLATNIVINDKSILLKKYICENANRVQKSTTVYLGNSIENELVPDDINLESGNYLVAKENDNIIGCAKFSLVGESIFINTLYADETKTYLDLINMIRNITNRRIEISVLPVRRDLALVLNELGFKRIHSDYILKFR